MKDVLKAASNILFVPAIAVLIIVLITTPNRLDNVKQASYDEGYAAASADLETAKAHSYDEGYQAGYNTGYTEVTDAAYEDGYTTGYSEGYADGAGDGYEDGYADAKAKYSISFSGSSTSSSSANVSSGSSTVSSSPSQGTTVYITKSGSKYHRSGCSYLSKSKIAISLSDAKTRGYTACSRCF